MICDCQFATVYYKPRTTYVFCRHFAENPVFVYARYRKALQDARLQKGTPKHHRANIQEQQSFLQDLKTSTYPSVIHQDRVDFAEDGDTVEYVNLIRKKILPRIKKHFPLGKKFTQIGSFYDGSKTGKLNDEKRPRCGERFDR